MQKISSPPKWLLISVFVITLLGLWWRIDIYRQHEWSTDELCQYKHTVGPLKPFWLTADYGESHSFPGDYLLTYPFIQIFKENKWGVAIPHFLSTLLGFYVLGLLCQRYLKHPLSWLMTFAMFALHRQLIYHALQLRPYSMLAALGLSTFYILESLMNPLLSPSRMQCILYWIALILTIIYHPYGLLIICCWGLFFLLRDYRQTGFIPFIQRRWRFWLSLSFVGLLLWLYYNKGNPSSPFYNHRYLELDVFQFIPNPLVDPINFLKAVMTNLIGFKLFYLLLIGIALRLWWPKQDRLIVAGFLMTIFILPILLLMIADAVTGYWFLQRQYVWVMAIFPLFTGWCWDPIFIFFLNKIKWNMPTGAYR
ncbi:MAG: hypothetical protein HY209_00385 [Candidatus Omnitrophica bacterium]|nr:hypothetical protein [Candidatus Omnitrophota bacterium]